MRNEIPSSIPWRRPTFSRYIFLVCLRSTLTTTSTALCLRTVNVCLVFTPDPSNMHGYARANQIEGRAEPVRAESRTITPSFFTQKLPDVVTFILLRPVIRQSYPRIIITTHDCRHGRSHQDRLREELPSMPLAACYRRP